MPLPAILTRKGWRAYWSILNAPLVFLLIYQFTHWFKPSQPYFVDYGALHNLSPQTLTDDVSPLFTYTLLPSTVVAALVFEFGGYLPALLTGAVADLLSLVFMYPSSAGLGLFQASELTFGLGFTSLFSVAAAVSVLQKPENYQKAGSWQRACTLIGTVTSSLVGQLLVNEGQLQAALLTSISFSALSLAATLGWGLKLLLERCAGGEEGPALEKQEEHAAVSDAYAALQHMRRESSINGMRLLAAQQGSTIAEGEAPRPLEAAIIAAEQVQEQQVASPRVGLCRRTGSKLLQAGRQILIICCDTKAAYIALSYGIVLAVHTLAMTNFQLLFSAMFPGEKVNGFLLSVAYIASVVGVFMLTSRTIELFLVKRLAGSLLVGFLVSAAAIFLLVNSGSSLARAGFAFIFYHTIAEVMIVFLSAQYGSRVRALALQHAAVFGQQVQQQEQHLQTPLLSSLAPRKKQGDVERQGAVESSLLNNKEGEAPAEEVVAAAAEKAEVSTKTAAHLSHFGAAFGALTVICQGSQIVFQSAVGPGALQLPMMDRFVGMAVLLCVMAGASVVMMVGSRCCGRCRL